MGLVTKMVSIIKQKSYTWEGTNHIQQKFIYLIQTEYGYIVLQECKFTNNGGWEDVLDPSIYYTRNYDVADIHYDTAISQAEHLSEWIRNNGT